MKKIFAIILTLSAFLLLCSCASDAQNDTDNKGDATHESYKVQLEYYSNLVEALQDNIMEEKESNFIAECAYKLQIEELEGEIDSLKEYILSIKSRAGSPLDTPTNSNSPEEEKNQFENMAKTDLFEVEMINGKLTVTNYLGTENEIALPQRINGVAVKSIGEEAFKGSNVTRITIPDGFESIGWFAFSACRSLSEIEIPATVTSVEYGAFDYCSPSLVITCEKGSYIEAYAKSWGIKVVTE